MKNDKSAAVIGKVIDKLAELPAQHKILLFVGTLLVFGLGFYFLYYSDSQEKIVQLNNSIVELTKRREALKSAEAQVAVLQKELAQSKVEVDKLLAFLPNSEEIPGLLESISGLGAQIGLENVLFQPQPERPAEYYSVIPIRLDLVGTFQQFGVFLDRLSKLARILKVENMTITYTDGNRLRVGCTLATYRYVEKAESPPGKK